MTALSVEARTDPATGAAQRGIRPVPPGLATEIAEHLAACLKGSYEAVIFDNTVELVGFALYRRFPDHIHLTRFVVGPAFRATGAGIDAFEWLWAHEWAGSPLVRRNAGLSFSDDGAGGQPAPP